MLVSINQPCYLPWCGLFERIDRADLHIHLDDVMYHKSSFFSRNRVLNRSGQEIMLSVPVRSSHQHTKFIDVKLVEDTDWRRKHTMTLSHCYRSFKYAQELLDQLQEMYARPYANLAELNIAFTEFLMQKLGITTRTLRSSELNISSDKDERLIELCRKVQATAYYSAAGAKDYIRTALFEDAQISLLYQNYIPEVYEQSSSHPFVGYLSVFDVLARHGAEVALRILRQGAHTPHKAYEHVV